MKKIFYLLLAVMMAANVMARNASFEIKSITHEVNVTHNKMSGLRFNVTVVINDYQYETVHCWGSLYYKDSKGEWIGVPFYNQADRTYCMEDLSSATGYITIGKSLSYHCVNESYTAQFKVFVPHNAITHPAGHVDYKISLRVQNDHYKQFVPNKSGGNTYDYYFALNWPQELKNEQPKEQPKAQAKTAESNNNSGFADLGIPSGTPLTLPTSFRGVSKGQTRSQVQEILSKQGISYFYYYGSRDAYDTNLCLGYDLEKKCTLNGVDFDRVEFFFNTETKKIERIDLRSYYRKDREAWLEARKSLFQFLQTKYKMFFAGYENTGFFAKPETPIPAAFCTDDKNGVALIVMPEYYRDLEGEPNGYHLWLILYFE